MNSLVFQVDLFSARDVLPRDIQEVLSRHKDITLKADLYKALAKIPEDQLRNARRATVSRSCRGSLFCT